MRSKKVALQAVFDSLNQITRSILSIWVRRTFILTLGDSLLGLNGLFSSVLSFLSLAELGFGSVISVCLYQSIAENDQKKISAYMRILRKVYWFTGIFILVGGMAFFPIVLKMINGEYEQVVVFGGYILHLVATSVSYFYSHRGTLLYADQEGYIVSRTNLIVYTLSLIAQIIVLTLKKSFFGFLICTIIQNLVSGIILTSYVNKKYTYLVIEEKKAVLPIEEKQQFLNKFKAMLVYKVSDYMIQGADNMIISIIIGTIMVGYYSNYNLIINMCWAIFGSVAVASTAGIGNIIHTEPKKVKETLFRLLLLQQFVFCVSTTGIFQLSSLFVKLFFSSDSILPMSFVALLSTYYYFRGIIHPLEVVRMGAGVFEDDKWKQLALAVLNIIISIVGAITWGIQGVVLGTFVCYFIRGMYLTPKQIFGQVIEGGQSYKYYKKIGIYLGVTIITNYILYFILQKINFSSLLMEFVVKGIICVAVATIVNIILFARTDEFEYLTDLVKNSLLKLFKNH